MEKNKLNQWLARYAFITLLVIAIITIIRTHLDYYNIVVISPISFELSAAASLAIFIFVGWHLSKSNAALLKKTDDLEKFKLAFNGVSDHVIITDAEGIILHANPSVERITGYRIQDIIGKKAGSKNLWGGQMEASFYATMWDTIKNKKKIFSGVVTNKRKRGDLYEAQVSISPVTNANGSIKYFVGIERDITKEREIDRAKTEFVSLASHQLRTPLSAINWYTEMLLAGDAGPITEEQKSYLTEVYTGNQRMVELVNALLNVSRIDLGTFMIEPEPSDITVIAQQILKELSPQIKNNKITIKTNFEPKFPLMNVDPKLIGIIFQNLLSNAVKYTPQRGVVTLSIEKKPSKALITVGDTGYGIPKNQQDKIFTKLFRADNIREKNTEGTGLGLYIVKAIIEASRGSIRFTSDENKGTTFYIELPLSGMKKKAGSKDLSPS